MQKQITTLCLTAVLLLTLAACGDSSSSVSEVSEAEVSQTESIEETSTQEDSAAEDSALEDSTLEEAAEPTLDEQFADFVSDATGICLKLRACDQKGNPVKLGLVVVSESQEAAETASDTASEVCSADTDSSGYAFLSQLELDQDYTLTVYDQDEALVGTVSLKIQSGEAYAGTTDGDTILLTVADDTRSNVDLAIIATNEAGASSSFSLFRAAKWTNTTEE
jgi:hypothetical protein